MSAEESQVPGPPTWREYLDARLAVLVTTQQFREEMRDMERTINGTIWKAVAVLSGLIATATAVIVAFG